MAILLPQRRLTQPQEGAGLDPSNRFAQLLREGFVYTPALGVLRSAPFVPSYTTGASLAPGPQGRGLNIPTTSAQSGLTVSAGLPMTLQTGGCSLLVVVDGVTPNGAGGSQGFLGVSNNFFGYSTTGLPRIFVGGADRAVSSVAMTPGRRHVIVYGYLRGSIATIHMDGALVASATPAAVGIDYAPTLFGHTQVTSTHGTHQIYLGVLFAGQVLSSADAIALSANPWQLFQPRRIWVAVAAGGGGGITAAGIPTAEAIGSPVVAASVSASGIASAEAFGSASVGAIVAAAGVPTAEAFGSPSLQASIQAVGIASTAALGSPAVSASIAAAGIATAEAFGSPVVGAVDGIAAVGIPSAEAFGSPAVQAVLVAAGIATGEAFGAAVIQARIAAAGIASGEAFGSPGLAAGINAAGIASAEAFGLPAVGEVSIRCVGIASAEAFGLPTVGDVDLVSADWTYRVPPFGKAYAAPAFGKTYTTN